MMVGASAPDGVGEAGVAGPLFRPVPPTPGSVAASGLRLGCGSGAELSPLDTPTPSRAGRAAPSNFEAKSQPSPPGRGSGLRCLPEPKSLTEYIAPRPLSGPDFAAGLTRNKANSRRVQLSSPGHYRPKRVNLGLVSRVVVIPVGSTTPRLTPASPVLPPVAPCEAPPAI